jgi:LacI family transcriptional regulator
VGSITIKDVAAKADVSIKTVSRVLNHEPNVREETRVRVLAAVDALGYTPNFAARALAGSRAYLIALYGDNPSPSYIGDVQSGAMSTCRNAGYHLLVEQIEDGDATRRTVEASLSAVRVDGVILTPPVTDRREVLDALDERGVPYVRIAPAENLDRGPYLYIDEEQAAFDMTSHLLSLGHRRIGFVKGHPDHSAARLRHSGYGKAMRKAGIEVDASWVEAGDFSFRSGALAAERLLALPDRPTAIFASNDDMALGVMSVANRMQLSVPRDLSVAGFDDSPVTQVVWPQLTTVRQPISKMAAEAAQMLIYGAESGPLGRLLEFELIVRGSTAPPAGA